MVARLDVEPLQDPIAALLRTAAELVALKDWTAQAFAQATADEQWMLAELLGRNLDRCSTLLVRLHGLNLAERRVALEEGMARLLVDVVRGVLVDVGVDPDDREVRRVVRRHFERAGELDEARR